MDTTTSPRSGLTVERLLQAKGLLDRAEVEEMELWWNSVNPFSIWSGAYQHMPWAELPDWARREIIDVYNSLPLRFATEFPRDTREDHEPC